MDRPVPLDRTPPSPVVGGRIALVQADVVRPLRHTVLRPGQPPDESQYVGDDHPLAAHVAVLAAEPTEARSARAGPVVAVGSLFPEEPPPWLAEEARVATMPDTHAGTARWWRIRGMATAEGHRGQGLGGVVLDQLLAVVADQGGLVWCNARVPAVPFYLRAGFLAAGEVFELPLIGAHQAMWRGVAAGWDTDLSTQVSGDPHHSQGAVHA